MKLEDYEKKAMETEADQQKILDRFYGRTVSERVALVELMNGIHGLSDEVGELNSALKKHFEYGKDLDVDNIREEVGDCFWRLAQICKAVNLAFEECMEANIRKLQEIRYKNGYSDEAAADENRDLHGEARAMLGTDEITQEDIDAYNKDQNRLSSPVANSQLSQNGQGFAEPFEDYDEPCEGQDYDAAMKMIKRARGEDA
jgi:NTP pyrophosphatase (non-canonical NTP hydrolase)